MPTITVPANAYCEVTDVEALVQHTVTFSTSTVPTLVQVQNWIIEAHQVTNAMLSKIGYIVPVVEIANQLTAGTQLQLQTAALEDDTEIDLKDSGGALSGAVRRGDLFLISGDSQYYVATNAVQVAQGDNDVTVSVHPPLMAGAAVSTNVTHTPIDTAEQILKKLCAHMVGAQAERRLSTAGGADQSPNAEALQEVADRLWKMIEGGKLTLIGAARSPKRSRTGIARLERRG